VPLNANDKQRFIIVTVGRTGSSLLGSILSDAGADFGISKMDNWDPRGGAYEYPGLGAIVRQFEYMNEISVHRPKGLLDRIKWTMARHKAKTDLKKLLPKVKYLKGDLEHLVHWSALLGYQPTVIVSYRRFGKILQSLGHLHPQLPSYQAEKYDKSLRNGLALTSIFGGCLIDYEELVDPLEKDWAGALSQATGIDKEALLTARANRVTSQVYTRSDAVEPYPDCQAIYEKLREMKGKYVPPSEATLRARSKR